MATWSFQVDKGDPTKFASGGEVWPTACLAASTGNLLSHLKVSQLGETSATAWLECQQDRGDMPVECSFLHELQRRAMLVCQGNKGEGRTSRRRWESITSSNLVAMEKCGESITSEQSRLSYTAAARKKQPVSGGTITVVNVAVFLWPRSAGNMARSVLIWNWQVWWFYQGGSWFHPGCWDLQDSLMSRTSGCKLQPNWQGY